MAREGLPYRRWLIGVARFARDKLLDEDDDHVQTQRRAD